jgi:hypothetical protein
MSQILDLLQSYGQVLLGFLTGSAATLYFSYRRDRRETQGALRTEGQALLAQNAAYAATVGTPLGSLLFEPEYLGWFKSIRTNDQEADPKELRRFLEPLERVALSLRLGVVPPEYLYDAIGIHVLTCSEQVGKSQYVLWRESKTDHTQIDRCWYRLFDYLAEEMARVRDSRSA